MRKLVLGLMAVVAALGLSGCHFGLGTHYGPRSGYHQGSHSDIHHHYDYHGPAAYCHYCYR